MNLGLSRNVCELNPAFVNFYAYDHLGSLNHGNFSDIIAITMKFG